MFNSMFNLKRNVIISVFSFIDLCFHSSSIYFIELANSKTTKPNKTFTNKIVMTEDFFLRGRPENDSVKKKTETIQPNWNLVDKVSHSIWLRYANGFK